MPHPSTNVFGTSLANGESKKVTELTGLVAEARQERFRPYPNYSSTGIEWIAEVPAHWEVKRLRFVVETSVPKTEVTDLDPATEVSFVPMEAVREYGGIDLDSTKPLSEVVEGYTYFRNGDVVVAKITPCFENGKGALASGLCGDIGFGTTELHVLRPSFHLNARFLLYLTFSDYFRRTGTASMYGAGGQKRISDNFIRDFRHPIPSLCEQRAIAAFLDHETAKIDALVDRKERLIELLQEKRIALITRAVTRGLDPNVPMKDSGVEWLGEIPAHWEVKRLKRVIMFQRGHDLPSIEREEGDIPVVSSSGVSSTHSSAMARAPGIVTGRYGTIGNFYLIAEDYWPLNTTLYSTNLMNNDPRFLWYMLEHLSPLFIVNALKSAVPGVDRNDIHPIDTTIPTPQEQQAITTYLDRETAKIDTMIAKVRKAKDRFEEFRTALISAAVTGKIDVRATPDGTTIDQGTKP